MTSISAVLEFIDASRKNGLIAVFSGVINVSSMAAFPVLHL